jgi:hypothetical protein
MESRYNKLYAFEWAGCALWTIVWGSLAYIALTERSITLGAGKAGLGGGHYEGYAAVLVGLTALAAAAGGIGWLFRLNAYCRLQRFALFVLWLSFSVYYVVSF